MKKEALQRRIVVESTQILMKSFLLFLLLFITNIIAHSQTVPAPKLESPNVSSLGLFGEVPISHFTGTPDISIPLHTVAHGNINIPITLRYHPSSVKPNEHPGWVGLGWNLQSYGNISRVRKGWFDEEDNGSASFQPHYPSPYNIPGEPGSKRVNVSDWESRLKEYFTFNENPFDPLGDEFSFNFMGYSGKFFYTGEEWTVVSDQKIKVELDGFLSDSDINKIIKNDFDHSPSIPLRDGQSRMFKGFTITVEDGTKYYFGGSSAIEFTSPYATDPAGPLFEANTWLLKKVVDVYGNEVVFEYDRTYPICKLSFFSSNTDYSCHYDWYSSYSWQATNVKTYTHGGYLQWPMYLKKIITENEEISFDISTTTEKEYSEDYLKYSNHDHKSRETAIELSALNYDIKNLQWQQLDLITIKNYLGKVKKKYQFNYSSSLERRLTLYSLYEQDALDSNEKVYEFDYNGIEDLPEYGGNFTDHWGFYNGKDVSNLSFSSLFYEKDTEQNLVTKGLIKKIKYPTGGYTNFIWEAHDYSDVVAADRQSLKAENGYAGGCRIKEVESYTEKESLAFSKKYYYKSNFFKGVDIQSLPSSGVLNGLPEYVFNISDREGIYEGDLFSYTLKSVNSLVSYSYNGSASHIGYSEVIEEDMNGAYTKYMFTNYGPDIHNVSHFDIQPTVIGWKLGEDKYITMSSLELERGKPTGTFLYNNDNLLVKKTINYYRSDPERFNHYVRRLDLRNSLGCLDYNAVVLASAYKEFNYNYHIVKNETTTYDKFGQSPVTTVTNYEYNSYNRLVNRVTTFDSKSNPLISEYSYPSDFEYVNQGSPINALLDKNIINPVIETKNWTVIDGSKRLMSSSLVDYKVDENLIVPDKVYSFSSNGGVTDFLETHISQGNGPLVRDSRYIPEVIYHNFNEKGKILSTSEKKGTSTSFIWGYNKCLPIAKIENSLFTKEDINGGVSIPFYTSFEEEDSNISDQHFKTGKFSHIGNYTLKIPQNEEGDIYILSYWGKHSNTAEWEYEEEKIVTTSSSFESITIGQDYAYIDEVRLYPAEAFMTTYTYEPLIGMTSSTSPNNITTYFEYDDFGRLELIKDQDGNILKKYKYNYQVQ